MYIEPNSEVYLLSGIGLDTTQRNTILFDSRESQAEYFKSKAVQSFLNVSYQRVNRGYFRCGVNAEKVYNVNYMMFRNTAFGDKWFYAFVTNVEYINDMTTQIEFEIDSLQTYWFDVQLLNSFVEREHTITDTFEDWIVSENLPTGQMAYDQPQKSGLFSEWVFCVLCPYEIETGVLETKGHSYCGIDSPCGIKVFGTDSELMNYLVTLNTKGVIDGVLSIYLIPQKLLTTRTENPNVTNANLPDLTKNKPIPFSVRKPSTKIGTYTPKNGKLFSYPYSYLTLSNGSGNSIDYRWELFERDKSNPFVTFEVYSDFINGYYMAVPVNYNGSAPNQTSLSGDTNIAFNFALDYYCSPQIPWISDTFKIYQAQNKVSMLSQVGSGLAQIGIGVGSAVASGGSSALLSGGAVVGGLNSIKNVMIQNEQAKTAPVNVHGGGGNNSMFDADFQDFYYSSVHVQPEVAKTIDDYFTMFGYACRQVKIPNVNARPHWTYTKTVGCNLKGSAPADDLKTIKDIFDNGITFWHNGDEIGNYSLDNSVK